MSAEVCVVHGKKRLQSDLFMGDKGWQCLPRKECRQQTLENDAVVCRVHNRRRNIVQMVSVGNGLYECLPHAQCHAAQAPPQAAAPSAVQAPPPPFGSNLQALPRSVTSSRSDVWCLHHGRRIPAHVADVIDGTHPVCRDPRIACFSSTLDSAETLAKKRCPEVFCAIHGVLRAPQFLTRREFDYVCESTHPCRGTSSQGFLHHASKFT